MGKIITTLTIEKRDKDGKLLETFTQPSRSWTKHFFDLLFEPLGISSNTLTLINDISVTPRTLEASSGNIPSPNLMCGAPAGNVPYIIPGFAGGLVQAGGMGAGGYYTGDQFGIVVGTGGGGPAATDDKLTTKIAHGEAATQLLHGGTEFYGFSFVNPNGQFSIRRYFTNVLGGAIAVTESGIYCIGDTTGYGLTSYLYCVCRDVFANVNVGNGQILSVVYTVSITV